MDLRTKKTRDSITRAFIELRAEKSLNKITVKELAEKAVISKATFYLHYKDIYELSDILQDGLVAEVIDSISDPKTIFDDPAFFTSELEAAFNSKKEEIDILFSQSENVFVDKIEAHISEIVFRMFPDYANMLDKKMILTVMIHGCFHAYIKYSVEDRKTLIDIIGRISESVAKSLQDL